METTKLLLVAIILGLNFTSCDKTRDNIPAVCDQAVIISSEEYNNAPDDQLTITNAEINDDCLTIKFSSSGCNGDTWELKLIDSGTILKTLPPKRLLRLSLKNQEPCDAVIGKELTFDITDLKLSGGRVLLVLKDYEVPILYEY